MNASVRKLGEGNDVKLIGMIICLIVCTLLLSNLALCAPLEIKGCSIGGVEVGGNVSSLYSMMGKKFTLKSYKKQGAAERVVVFSGDSAIGEFQVTDEGKIIQGEMTSNFVAPNGIDLRSNLGAVLDAYGKGKIDPTEAGYYVWFDKLPGISFLISNHDVPKSLRNIPDDVFTNNHERKILKLRNAKIKSIRVSCTKN